MEIRRRSSIINNIYYHILGFYEKCLLSQDHTDWPRNYFYRFFRCKKKSSDVSLDDKSGPSYQLSLWKTTDTPPGADQKVPDSLGGNGFEAIASSLGFTTYTNTEFDLKHSGDPRAVVGGHIRFTISRFPLSFRPFFYGQNSNFLKIFK